MGAGQTLVQSQAEGNAAFANWHKSNLHTCKGGILAALGFNIRQNPGRISNNFMKAC